MPNVSPERTGWRDKTLCDRHREWGWNCPAVDIDLLMIEYDSSHPVALVEYKHEQATPQMPSHPSYCAMAELGTRAGVPVFAVRYAGDLSWWKVTPLNDLARTWTPTRTTMTERGWVALLYRIRGRKLPADLFAGDWETQV